MCYYLWWHDINLIITIEQHHYHKYPYYIIIINIINIIIIINNVKYNLPFHINITSNYHNYYNQCKHYHYQSISLITIIHIAIIWPTLLSRCSYPLILLSPPPHVTITTLLQPIRLENFRYSHYPTSRTLLLLAQTAGGLNSTSPRNTGTLESVISPAISLIN